MNSKLDQLIKANEGTQQTLRELTQAVSKLALIEERQTADRKAVERVTDDQKKLDERLRAVEKAIPNELDRRLCDLEKKQTLHNLSSSGFFKVVSVVCMLVVGGLMTLVLKG